MAVYLLFLLISILVTYIYEKSNSRCMYILLITLFTLFSGMRYDVGVDYNSYRYMFDFIGKDENFMFKKDLGFYYLVRLINLFFSNSRINFLIISFIIACLTIKIIFKFSSNKVLSIILYITIGGYLSSFNIIRQYLALAILLQLLLFIEKKAIKSYIILLISSLFHKTAFLLFPIREICYKKQWNKWTYFIVFVFNLTCLYFYDRVLINLITKIDGFSAYSNTRYLNEGANVMIIVLHFSILIFVLIFSKGINQGLNNLFLKLYFIGVMILIISLKGFIIKRIADYFLFFIVILLPEAIRSIKDKNQRFAIQGIITFCLVIYMMIYLKNSGNMLPYKINIITLNKR